MTSSIKSIASNLIHEATWLKEIHVKINTVLNMIESAAVKHPVKSDEFKDLIEIRNVLENL